MLGAGQKRPEAGDPDGACDELLRAVELVGRFKTAPDGDLAMAWQTANQVLRAYTTKSRLGEFPARARRLADLALAIHQPQPAVYLRAMAIAVELRAGPPPAQPPPAPRDPA